MYKVLFIIPTFFNSRPRSLRLKNILAHTSNKIKSFVLYTDNISQEIITAESNMNIKIVKGSVIGKIINSHYYSRNIKRDFFLRKLFRFILKKLIFPDLYRLEISGLEKATRELITMHDINSVFIYVQPFSLLLLSKFIKSNFPAVKVFLDIGDPLYKNPINTSILQPILSKNFERKYLKYLDYIFVTNNSTLEHYLSEYKDVIDKGKISVLPHGTSICIKSANNHKIIWKNEITLVYAGIFYKNLREPFELYKAITNFNNNGYIKTKLLVYGTTPPYFKKLPSKSSSNFIKFYDSVAQKNLYEIYNSSDIVVLIDNAFGFQSPGKVFELLTTGKPILFIYNNERSESLKIMEAYQGAIITKNNYAQIIKQLKILFNKKEFYYTNNIDLQNYQYSKLAQIVMEKILIKVN